MTEQQWLTSTNPAELVAFLGERITDGHQRLYFEACRKERDAEYSRTKNSDWEVPAALRAEILRDIVGNPFVIIESKSILGGYIRDRNPVTRLGERLARFDDAWLQWNDGTIPLMVDAMMNEECQCGGSGIAAVGIYDDGECYSCPMCYKGRIPRAEPQWGMMPVIADALEEAGCRDQYILDHLRDAKCECSIPFEGQTNVVPGSIFVGWGHSWQPCSTCKGTGRIKRRHWRGCHVVELLTPSRGSARCLAR